MKKKFLLFIVLTVISTVGRAQTAAAVLQKMYNRYQPTWRSTLKFNQTTEVYTDGKLLKTQTWYETIVYPDLLRIDFDQPNSKSGILFRRDSTYVFTNDTITRAVKRTNPLIFLVGGWFKMPFDGVLKHLTEEEYDLSKIHTATWKGRPVYAIGAMTDNEAVNQLWLDQEKLIVVRVLNYANNVKAEYLFDNHALVAGTWSETYCAFYNNGALRQIEKYHNLKANEPVDMRIFEPGLVGKISK